MMFNKVLVAAPADFPVRDAEAVCELLRGIDPERDMIFGHGVLDVLDHATATPGRGGKLLIDATDLNYERGSANFHVIWDEAAEGLTPYEKLWLGLANIDPARDISVSDGAVRVDARAKTAGLLRRSAPRNDARAASSLREACGDERVQPKGNIPVRWPNVVVMDEETVSLVDSRWAEYGLGEGLPSPSERYRKLLFSEGAEV
jgi:4-hydroxy-3-polyprenylbenzoate decarboxylase